MPGKRLIIRLFKGLKIFKWVITPKNGVFMSRSYKKHPIIQGCGDKTYKKLFNRRLRRKKQLDYPSGNAYRKEHNNDSWYICDVLFGYFTYDSIPEDDERPYYWYMK